MSDVVDSLDVVLYLLSWCLWWTMLLLNRKPSCCCCALCALCPLCDATLHIKDVLQLPEVPERDDACVKAELFALCARLSALASRGAMRSLPST